MMTGVSDAAQILVCDDQADVVEALRLLLKGAGYRTRTATSPEALLEAAEGQAFDLILMDMNYARDTTSGREGLDLLGRLHGSGNPAPVVVMTAWGDVDLAVEAMRRGACDFVLKPWDNAKLLATVDRRLAEDRGHKQGRQQERDELAVARGVQQRLFPEAGKAMRTVTYAGQCVPAREVGGDIFDFLDVGPECLGIVLADVSGKGVPAALLMAHLQGLLRSQSGQCLHDPRSVLKSVNRLFHQSTAAERFATLFLGLYSDEDRRLRYVNCGHPSPLLVRADGREERLGATATVLGLFPQWGCEEAECRLGEGDALLLFSDGVAEVEVGPEQALDGPALGELVRSGRGQGPATLVERVLALARQLSGERLEDDMTVVAMVGRDERSQGA